MKNFLSAGVCLFFILSMLMLTTLPAAARFSEKKIPMGSHKSDEQVFAGSVQVSDDKQHIAYVSKNHDGSVRVWIDGITGVAYTGISTPRFAPGTSRLGYIAADGKKMFTVIDGKNGPGYARADSLVFSPDGSRLAYRVQDDDGHVFAVVDGAPGPRFVNILTDPGILFSPDSRHTVYIGINEAGSQVLVKDQVQQRAFDKIGSLLFSPNSSHLAYTAKSEAAWQVVNDDTLGREYSTVANLLFSPDSRSLAYLAGKGKKISVVKNNEELLSGANAGMPFFSPDGSRFGFLMRKDNGWCVVVDGKKGPLIARPDKVAFSDDNRDFAYSALIGTTWAVIKNTEKIIDGLAGVRFLKFLPDSPELVYVAVTKDDKEYVAVAGKRGKDYDSAGMPVLRPGSAHEISYVAQRGNSMLLVENGTEHTPYKSIGIPKKGEDGKVHFSSQNPFFSSDGKHMAYAATDTENRRSMVVDGTPHESYEAVTEPIFSPDGKHIAYTAQKSDKWLVVVDGIEGKERFDGILKGGGIVFDSPASFYVLTLNLPGPSFYKLAVTIGPDKK